MSSTLATSLGGQRGRPTQVGGPIGFDFVSVSDSRTATLKRTPRSHTESDSGALDMAGKIISRRFQWYWSKCQIHPESTEIVEIRWHPESVLVLHHPFSVFGPCIELIPLGVRPGGVSHDLNSLYSVVTALVRV